MSQVGLKERSAKDKTESKQQKSVKSFIARTQAKVDAKLTQSRLLPTLSPAKRENDPFHPSLDLSPSQEEGTSSNVISDNEQPEDVAKELFPLAQTTAHTVKGKGAQEPQHQIQAPAPPTNSTFDFTGHKMAKTRILSKWLTKLPHLCCVLSSFSKFCGFRLSFMITVDAWLILSAKMSCTSNISGKTKTQLVWRNELLTCPTQYKMETIAMYVDNID